MSSAPPHPVVHLELRTGNLACACAFFTRLFGWEAQRVDHASGSYLVLGFGSCIEGGIVEHETEQPFWLPYVEVPDVRLATARAESLGASQLLPPREGPAGWRSILATPAGGAVALWQPKTKPGAHLRE